MGDFSIARRRCHKPPNLLLLLLLLLLIRNRIPLDLRITQQHTLHPPKEAPNQQTFDTH
jgi:hypothetical protein